MTDYLVVSNRHIKNGVFFESPVSLSLYLSQNPTKTLIFAFWSHIIKKDMLDAYQCFGLHTGFLLRNKGKGGSPIENLQKLGVRITTLCAFKLTEGIDDGPVELAIPMYIDTSKGEIVQFIDDMLPYVVDYLTAVQPEVPERFMRLK